MGEPATTAAVEDHWRPDMVPAEPNCPGGIDLSGMAVEASPAGGQPATFEPSSTPPLTLAGVLEVLERSPYRSTPKFAEMASAIRQVARVLHLDLSEIPADPAELAKVLANANPALVGMRVQRWGRVKSLLRAALAEVGLKVMAGRDLGGLTPAWKALMAKQSRRVRFGISRFVSFSSRRGIEPEDVDDAAFAAFRTALKTTALQSNPEGAYRNTVNVWNEAVKAAPGWPQTVIERPTDARRAPIPAESFEASFREDLEASLTQGGDPDPFAKNYWRPLRAATIHSRRKQLLFAARTLAATGVNLPEITAVSVIVDPVNAEAILRRLVEQHGGETSPSIGVLAQTLCAVARRWVRAPDADIARLAELAKRLTPKHQGMAQRNRERLRQFKVEANVDALLGLPARVTRQVRARDSGGKSDAVRFAVALTVEILTQAPLRLSNLTGLRLDQHIKRVRRGRNETVHIFIPAEETKAGLPLEAMLPPETVRLLDIYLKVYRPRIEGGVGPYLFPGRGGERRNDTRFGGSISKFIARETGLQMHPHFFRHFAAMLYLQHHPDDIETVRRFLGHGSTRTTLKAYADPSGDLAFKSWSQLVADHRDGRMPPRARRTARTIHGERR